MSTLKAIISEVDIVTLIVWVFAIIEAFNLISKGLDTFCDRLGIERKSKREKKEMDTTVQDLKITSESLNKSMESMSETLNNLREKDTEMDKVLENLAKDIKTLGLEMNNLKRATVEDLYDCINRKCKYYMYTLNGIPSDEFDSFKRLIEAYSANGGNHGLQARVEWCIANLPILQLEAITGREEY